jgi:hypothetical protein
VSNGWKFNISSSFWNIKEVGIKIYPRLNSLITIVTKRV